jgi:DNA-entry nuclease
VTIGGQTYREIDNGRANVLVPVDDPLRPPALVAQQRKAIVDSLFMAEHPFSGTLSGVAAMFGASAQTRNRAMVAGATADAVLSMVTPRGGAPIRRPAPAGQGQVAAPGMKRDNIRPSELNALGQAGRVEATAVAPMLGTGTKAYWRRRPPGFESGYDRGHLYPRELGGSGEDQRNLVTLTPQPTNRTHMASFEREVAKRVRSGEVVEYSSTPLYTPGVLPPGAVLMTATGSRGTQMARVVANPAGRQR